jgi:hypothetical protein
MLAGLAIATAVMAAAFWVSRKIRLRNARRRIHDELVAQQRAVELRSAPAWLPAPSLEPMSAPPNTQGGRWADHGEPASRVRRYVRPGAPEEAGR